MQRHVHSRENTARGLTCLNKRAWNMHNSAINCGTCLPFRGRCCCRCCCCCSVALTLPTSRHNIFGSTASRYEENYVMRNIPVFNCRVYHVTSNHHERSFARARAPCSIKYTSARQELYRAVLRIPKLSALVHNENSRIETRIAHGTTHSRKYRKLNQRL